MNGPTIETERLVLRRPDPKDADGYVDFFLSDRACFVGQTPRRHRAWVYFAGEIGHWEIRGWGMFAVTMKGEDTCIGVVGPSFPDGWPEHELGWLLWPTAEGKGIGFEAACAARRYAYENLGWKTAVSYVDRRNTRSIRLAERLGCTIDDTASGIDPEDFVYRHPAPEVLT